MTKAKAKTAAVAVKVPQTREEASQALRAFGEHVRAIGRIEADMNDELARVKERYEAQAQPLRTAAEAAMQGLQVWCEANRETILDKRTKTADLGTGTVSWRLRPPSVTIRGAEAVLAACAAMGFQRFVRTKSEINKDAMREEPDLARTIPGVTIGSGGEDFIAEPFEAELAGAAA